MATKPRAKKATNALLQAIEFVSLVQKETDHCTMQSQWVVATDGVATLGTKIDVDFEANPLTRRLLAALQRASESLAITQLGEGSLQVASGALRVKVPCAAQVPGALLWADPNIAPLKESFIEACKAIGHIASEAGDRIYQCSLLVENDTISATNGQVLIQYWHGNSLPPYFVLPKASVSILLKINKKLVGFGYSGNSCTFHFEDESWFRTQLYEDKWPNLANHFNSYDGIQKSIPKLLFTAVNTISDFTDNNKLSVTKEKAEVSGASYDLDGIDGAVIFNKENLKQIEKLAESYSIADGKVYFFGKNVRIVVTVYADKRKQPPEGTKFASTNFNDIDDDIPF